MTAKLVIHVRTINSIHTHINLLIFRIFHGRIQVIFQEVSNLIHCFSGIRPKRFLGKHLSIFGRPTPGRERGGGDPLSFSYCQFQKSLIIELEFPHTHQLKI